MTPFTITNHTTAKDYFIILLRKTYKNPFVILLTVLALASIIINVLYLLNLVDKIVADMITPLFVIFLVVIPLFTLFRARNLYHASPRLKEGITYTFSDEGVQAKAVDSNWSYTWNAVIKTGVKGNLLLIYPSKNTADVIKKELLSYDQLDYIKSKGKR